MLPQHKPRIPLAPPSFIIYMNVVIERSERKKRKKMADTGKGSSGGSCNDRCGCPSPCPGGESCRCRMSEASGGDQVHEMCPCGEQCSCNPCTCTKTRISAKAKSSCTCGEGCTCATCAA